MIASKIHLSSCLKDLKDCKFETFDSNENISISSKAEVYYLGSDEEIFNDETNLAEEQLILLVGEENAGEAENEFDEENEDEEDYNFANNESENIVIDADPNIYNGASSVIDDFSPYQYQDSVENTEGIISDKKRKLPQILQKNKGSSSINKCNNLTNTAVDELEKKLKLRRKDIVKNVSNRKNNSNCRSRKQKLPKAEVIDLAKDVCNQAIAESLQLTRTDFEENNSKFENKAHYSRRKQQMAEIKHSDQMKDIDQCNKSFEYTEDEVCIID